MHFTEGNYEIEAQIKSPMGWIKLLASLTFESEDVFTGHAKLLGITVELTDCKREGDRYYFAAAPTLPFGVLNVLIEATFNEDGSISGIANAPKHKPMQIKGQVRN